MNYETKTREKRKKKAVSIMGDLFTHVESLLLSISLIVFATLSIIISLFSMVSSLFSPSPKRFDPTSILITGASSGIGKTLAVNYAKKGVFLAITGRNKGLLFSFLFLSFFFSFSFFFDFTRASRAVI